jgi:hypothetical protein
MEEKMKRKHFFNAVMAALIAVIFSVVAGCGSTDVATVDGEPGTAAAAQLAADINTIEVGKATVSGDTVALTGGVRLQTALTVPAGVTLDLTKETLQLANNAVFTVNGTVNAKAEGINIDSAAASPATINGSGTIYLKSKGRLLNIGGGKKLTLDGGTLVGLADNNNSLVGIGNGGELIMKSGAITGNANEEGSGGNWSAGVGVNGGTFTMEGGTISGNTAKYGGGVSVTSGTFTMFGGAISGNTAQQYGGGVAVALNGTFTLSDGTISGNTAKKDGGGVSAMKGDNIGGTFIMEGGAISGNTANYGGGVDVWLGSTFTLKGGRIQGSADSGGFTKNTANNASLSRGWDNSTNTVATAKWGTGGTYTKGGEVQSDDSDIGSTNDTLIAVPGK